MLIFYISLILFYFQLPRLPNSVASLSYNHDGQLLAVASSYTYQEAEEMSVVLLLTFNFYFVLLHLKPWFIPAYHYLFHHFLVIQNFHIACYSRF